MRKYLLPESGNFYKANLHCHSTVSDGKLSPKELKDLYKSRGYSIIAYTDHDVLISHDDLNDENFLALHGYEMEVTEDKPLDFRFLKTCHMCLIALDKDNMTQVCWHRSKYLFGNAAKYKDKVVFDESKPDFERVYSPECINEIVKAAHEHGFFITYNHPRWSLERYPDYMSYDGFDAMEILNGTSFMGGFPDLNDGVYDDMLTKGKKLYCIATDDNHNFWPPEHALCASFCGFVMIKADKLEYSAVTSALKNGEFYCSRGPEIYELYVEDGFVHVRFSPCKTAALSCANRRTFCVGAKNDSEYIDQATFPLTEGDGYFRITITDDKGKSAYTNAYFI
ncbi:MAG: CehA/McbA family metallohydrolase [Clostridia bacterium]|nr:CehA/McbA family metallohydrolase [Clostridia bacterium]